MKIVNALCTRNNTHIVVADASGRTLIKCSAGKDVVSAVEGIGRKIGTEEVELRLRGYGRSRSSINRGLRNVGVRVVKVSQLNSTAHNGCRPKKRRRL